MAPAGKVERFWEVTVAPWGQVPGLCPLLPFLAHVCTPAPTVQAHTRFLLVSSGGHHVAVRADGATARSKWRSACLAACVMEGVGKESTCLVAMRTTVACVRQRLQGGVCVPARGQNGDQTSQFQRRTAPPGRCSPH